MKKTTHPQLEAIANKVGEPYFLMAVSHLFAVGTDNLTDENVKETIAELAAEEEPKNAIITNRFKISILETSLEIAKAATILEIVKFASGHIY